MVNVLVTGASGQLARNIKDLEKQYAGLNLVYKNSNELDITNLKAIKALFEIENFKYSINCAAYTAVDKAESDFEKASNVNELGTSNLALACSKYKVVLIHISTDFVFDGNSPVAYKGNDQTNPLGNYGLTKLNGEKAIQSKLKDFFIIRTSWLYSEHGNNFMKTMIKLGESRDTIGVVDDQIGTPTYAKDLAMVILNIITSKSNSFGVYHYSNEGVASWYDFAKAIFEIKNSNIEIIPIKTASFPTPAKRPYFSVLNKEKIKDNLGIEIPHWRDSLKKAVLNLNNLTN